MATILIADDRDANRDFLATLLGYRTHRVLQAADGGEALTLARAERPDLIISDILMPTMDGYELVRQLRMDPTTAQTPVIFSSAHFLNREARALAESCGVPFILPKPCEPETVLRLVDAALHRTPVPATAPSPDFDREHLQLVSDKLRETTDELGTVYAKLTALIEVSQQLALEADPQRLFQEFARAARQIIGARCAVVARSDPSDGPGLKVFSTGFDVACSAEALSGQAAEILEGLLVSPGTRRCHVPAGGPPIGGLPRGHPAARSLLASSIVSLTNIYGWVCVTEKIGFDAFSEDDERVLGILGAQLGRIYENGRLYVALKLRTVELENEVAAHSRAEVDLSNRARLAALGADIGVTLTRGGPVPAVLQECATALVRHLDAAFARIWTLNAGEGILELQASAGMYTHLNGPHSRVPIGHSKIGSIAASGQRHLTNDVPNDPLISDRDWARCNGMVAFAGYPLIVDDQLLGVMAMFGRQPLTPFALDALGSVADEIALGIRRQRVELEVQQNERRFRSLVRNASDLVMVLDEHAVVRYASPSHERIFGYRADELVGCSSYDFLHPDDVPIMRTAFAANKMKSGHGAALEYRQRCKDGSWRVLEGIGINLLKDSAVGGFVVNSWDVTTRKHAEERTAALLEVAQDLAGTLDLEQIVDRVQQHTAAMLPCDAVETFAFDEDTQSFRVIGQRGMANGQLAAAISSELRRDQVFGGLTRHAETAVVDDFDTCPDALRTAVRQYAIGALVIAPLVAHDRCLGALVAFRTTGRPPFEPDQAELCTGIAKQLALAMEAVNLHRSQREEALVAGALASAGKELIAALGQPNLLDRLSQVTTEILQCDVSGTMLRRPDDTWVQVASAGWHPDEREAVHALVVPHAVMAPLVAQLERDEVVHFRIADVAAQWVTTPRKQGIQTVICAPLRCAGQVIGIHTAGFRRQTPELTGVQRRIAEGLATLTSLALDNVQLIERLDGANRLKSDFVATMSHELRTPLNIIIGYTELLRAAEFGSVSAEQADTLEWIDANAHRLLALVNATLDVSRLESGEAALALSEIDLAELLGELQDEMQSADPNPAVTVRWPALPPSLHVCTDRVKLKVVLKNLVDNAVKFTDEGRVDIAVQVTNRTAVFTVCDTGIGIPPDSLEIIFEWFRQLEPTTTRRFGGVGLGLYLARRLAELLGGSIAVESAVGRGSTFRVAIPSLGLPTPEREWLFNAESARQAADCG